IGQSTEHKALEAAAKAYAPLVVWGGQLGGHRYCVVGTDNQGGARLAAEHLLAQGRRRIVFVGDPSIPEIRLRRDGYEEALRGGPRGTAAPRVLKAHMTPEAAYEAMRAFIRRGSSFDAVLAATDVIAISAMRALVAGGRSIPGDVAV